MQENKEMIVKSSISMNVLLLAILIGVCVWELLPIMQTDWVNPKDKTVIMLIVAAFMIIVLWYGFLIIFETGKKLMLDKRGCTVVYLWGYKETYRWEDLCVKQILYNTSKGSYKIGSYDECVIFSLQPVKRKYPAYITSYEKTRYRKTLFYVNFIREGEKRHPYLGLYEVEREEFLSKMQEWGVELEDMRQKKYERGV